jgi:glycosyltransferase involved in cell wall biosynthesis
MKREETQLSETSPDSDRHRRVLVVAPQPFFEDRGTPIAVRLVIEALLAAGQNVDLLTFPIGREVAIDHLRIVRSGRFLPIHSVPIGFSLRKLVLDAALSIALWDRLRTHSYRCVHAVEEAVFPALLFARRRRIPVIYDMQSCLPDQLCSHPLLGRRPLQHWLRACERRALAAATVVACSSGLGSYVRGLVPAANVSEWLFPGTSPPVAPEEMAALRSRYALPPQARVVLYAGNLASYQGVASLIEAIPEVVARVPQAVFMIVGADGATDKSIVQAIEASTPAEALRIVLRQPQRALAPYLALAEIVVSPRTGGNNVPLKVFDYMAAGKPIVASDLPMHRAVLDGERALLVEPSAAGFSRGVLRLMEEPDLAARLGAQARAYSRALGGEMAFRERVARIYAQATTENLVPLESRSA